jgi:hypothetical protein
MGLSGPSGRAYGHAVAAVRFGFGVRPSLSEALALSLADVLSRQPNLPAQSAAHKIRDRARRYPGPGETSEDLELTRDEMSVLLALIDKPPPTNHALRLLRAELRCVLPRD